MTNNVTQLWIVRHYDGFDNEWMDVSDPMTEDEAKKLAGDNNFDACGKRDAGYNDIDYYKAFPLDGTIMVFSERGKREIFGEDAVGKP